MIKRDYFIRMVQELVQALQRVEFLRRQQDYAAALREIERTLARFWELTPEQINNLGLDDWIALCWQEGGMVGDKLSSLADLFKQQGDLFELQEKPAEAQRSYCMALGLLLETLRTSMVSLDLIQKAEALIQQTSAAERPSAVDNLLIGYLEARGRFSEAEDALFAWCDTGAPEALTSGLEFYERLLAKTDEELNAGDLPRAEVEEGRRELLQRQNELR